VQSVAYSPDGTYVATASHDRTAKLWDATTGKLRGELQGHTDRLWTVGFSPDGRLVITASEDRTALVWDAATGRPLAELRGHAGAVNAAAFSPDDRLVATGGDDGAARIHQRGITPTVEDLLRRARERVTRELTPEERIRYLRDGGETGDDEQQPEIISL
jgi:WD40 repeat protein